MGLNRNTSSEYPIVLHACESVVVRRGIESLLRLYYSNATIAVVPSAAELNDSLQKGLDQMLIIYKTEGIHFGISDILRIKKNYSDTKILLVIGKEDFSMLHELIQSGVEGYITINCPEKEWSDAISEICNGQKFFSNKILHYLVENKYSTSNKEIQQNKLTPRETEILQYIAKGLNNQEIGTTLTLSPHTVHSHRKNIMKKLSINTASGLVLFAIQSGLLDLNPK